MNTKKRKNLLLVGLLLSTFEIASANVDVPTLAENSAYTLKEVSEASINTITKYVKDPDTGNLVKKYYLVDLKKKNYGYANSESAKTKSITLTTPPVKDVVITAKYDTSNAYESRVVEPTEDTTKDFIDMQLIGSSTQTGGAIYNTSKNNVNINSNFIGNCVKSEEGDALGGAIYNLGIENKTTEIASITGDFVGNYAQSTKSNAFGGAIYNGANYVLILMNGMVVNGFNSTIEDITGNFIGNYAQSVDSRAFGGAIYNSSSKAKIGKITGDFIGNYAKSTNFYAYGGAIANSGPNSLIGDITGDFIGNYTQSTTSYSQGGAIYNGGSSPNLSTIDNINGDFIGNYAQSTTNTASGGAICNIVAKIGNITGDFTNNYVMGTLAYGGAIYNNNGLINYITGNFIANYAQSTKKSASGAAIRNYIGKIGNITGDFISNYAIGTGAYGGAIYNESTDSALSSIGDITGDFIANYAEATTNSAGGGAIYNVGSNSEIGNIEGIFNNNYVQSINSTASGGSIYNSAKIGNIIGDFNDNYALSTDSRTYGGAIYNGGTIEDITGNFTGNYAKSINLAALGGAIYVYKGIIGDIDGNFVDNYAKATNGEASGGAVRNHTSKIGNITGDFISNYSDTDDSNAYGGAIYNHASTIENIKGKFSNNYVKGGAYSYGGAIYNNIASIGDIEGDFLNNYAESTNSFARGAAIYNVGSSSTKSTIGNIKGNFTGNYTKATNNESSGGAIRNHTATIGDITGNFTNNYSIGTGSFGGVIYNNKASIDDIKGDFIANYAEATTASATGGVIYNYGDSAIDNITGNFANNYTLGPSGYGGVIYNNASTIGCITGDFVENYVEATGSYSRGGVFYNYKGTVSSVEGDFIRNYAKSNAYAIGGAIYNSESSATISITDSIFEDNAVISPNTDKAQGGAIYNQNGAVVNLNNVKFKPAGKITIEETEYDAKNDIYNKSTINVSGTNTFSSEINGENGILNFTDTHIDSTFSTNVANQTVNLNAGTLNLGVDNALANSTLNINGDIVLNSINKVASDVSAVGIQIAQDVNWQYQFDVDLANEKSDNLAVTEHLGNLTLSKFNILSDMTNSQDNVKVTFSDVNLNAILADDYAVTTSENTYNLSVLNDATGSHLIIEKNMEIGGLASAIKNKSDQYIITSSQEEVVDSWGSCDGNVVANMDIEGNNQNIISTLGVEGINVGDNVQLDINDVNEIKGFNNALTVNNGSELNINNTSFSNNTGDAVITNNGGVVNVNATTKDININAGSAINAILADGGEINFAGGKNINISGNIVGSNNAKINISTNSTINSSVEGINVSQTAGNVNINSFNNGSYNLDNAILTINGDFNNSDFALNNANANIFAGFNANELQLNGGTVNTANGVINSINANVAHLGGTTNFIVDASLAGEAQMDKLVVLDIGEMGGTINVSAFNYLSTPTKDNISINFASDSIKDAVTTSVTSYINEIYNYAVSYDPETGNFNFVGGGSSSNGFNPAIMSAPIAAQMGGYLTQLNSYDEAFRNMDMYMLMTKEQRQSMKYANKYATADSNLAFSPLSTPYTNTAGWFRPFTTFESVGLKNGPKVDNISYGSYAGLESEMVDLGRGWDGMMSLYAGYNGSHQKYQGNSIYQNGGTLGLVGMAYKDNFFTGLTANVGASVADANTMFGSEDFAMLMTGVASKTGYNWELANGKFIIQPNYTMSYSMINTFDFTNSTGVRINADPLHAIQIEPAIKFIGNLPKGWQPYAGVSVVMNIMDDTKFKANDVSLPELSIKPYAKYGVGVRKTWGERFTGFFQTFVTSGGRNGVGLQGSFRWKLGNDSKNNQSKANSIEKKEVKKSKE